MLQRDIIPAVLQSILSRSSGLQHAVLQKNIQRIESTKTYMQWQSSFTHKQLDVIFDVLKSSCKALVPAVSSESNAYQTWVFASDWDEHAPRQTRLRIWQTYQSCWFSQPRFVHFVGVGRHWLSLSFWSHLASTCINHSESTNQSQWWNPNPSSSTMLESWKQSEMLSCCMSHMHFICHICQSHTSFASPRFTRAASAGWGASMTWQKNIYWFKLCIQTSTIFT